jgi:hypothetical protein
LSVFAFAKNKSKLTSFNFGLCEKTFHLWVWDAVDFLYQNMDEIHNEEWNNQPKPFTFKSTYLIVDTTPFKCSKPEKKSDQELYYSTHYHMYCFKYQIVCNRNNGLIVDLKGPFPGNVSDLTIFIESNTLQNFPDWIHFFADRIYYGPHLKEMDRVYIGFRGVQGDSEKEFNNSLGNARSIIEHLNGRLKICGENSLHGNSWKHGEEKHKKIIFILAGALNIEIKCGHPLQTEIK